MMATNRMLAASLLILGSGLLFPLGSQAQQVTGDAVQTLDRVTVFGSTRLVEMGFNDATVRNPDFSPLTAVAQSQFTSCQTSNGAGLFCLDGKVVRNWPEPKNSSTSMIPFSCADTALGLDTKRSDTCTSVTVDLSGNLWIAGRKNSAYSLFKITKRVGTECADTAYFKLKGSPTESTQPTQWANYCAYEVASGRPILLDISAVDGDVGNLFDYGPGILGLEQRKTVMFYKDVLPAVTPIDLGSGKTAWALSGSETLTGATILQRASAGATDSFAVVTTSTGRVLAKDVAANSTVFSTNFNIPAKRAIGSAACGSGVAGFETRSSSKSGRVYVLDKAVCQIVALVPNWTYNQPVTATPVPAFSLINATGPKSSTDSTIVNQTLSTSYGSTTVPPDGIAISPGIDIDLSKCASSTGCPFIPDNGDGNEYAGAQLSGVVYTGPGNMTLFQIKNIPDCRLLRAQNLLPVPAICTSTTVVTDSQGRQYLNVSKLMPDEVLKLFPAGFGPAPAKLPDMLISPQYTATEDRNYRFDAFFGYTDPTIRFRGTFTAQFDITQLFGVSSLDSRCGTDYSIKPNLNWDLITTVSERYASVGGPTGTLSGDDREHVDILTNTDCFNPTSGSGTRWSLYTYGLQPAPGPIPARTYLDLVVKLYNDLQSTQTQLACNTVDEGGYTAPANPPLYSSTCSTLDADWLNGKDKLDKCIAATTSPKTSAGDQNCQSFLSQLTQYKNHVNGAARWGDDPANRIGELDSRLQVLFHVFNVHFLPSVPDGGFPAL